MKTCTKCNIEKPRTEFHKDKTKSDGLFSSCKECRKSISKKYYNKNFEDIKEKRKEYYKNNSEKVKKYTLSYQRRLRTANPHQLVCRRLRNRLYYALKKTYWKKNTKFSEYIGCTKDTLLLHLESQFTNGMSWDNYGEWHIDHIVPLSSAKTEEELYKLCHYTNLQPLWEADNKRKGAKKPLFKD